MVTKIDRIVLQKIRSMEISNLGSFHLRTQILDLTYTHLKKVTKLHLDLRLIGQHKPQLQKSITKVASKILMLKERITVIRSFLIYPIIHNMCL